MKTSLRFDHLKEKITCFPGYKQFLLNDFDKHRDMAELTSQLSFSNGISIQDWVAGLEGSNLSAFTQNDNVTDEFSFQIDLENLAYKPKYNDGDINELYAFFCKYEDPSYKYIAKRYHDFFYYVFDHTFFGRIDDKLLRMLPDYSWQHKLKRYVKKIGNLYFRLEPYQGYSKYPIVKEYIFPKFSIEYEDQEIYPFVQPDDLRNFLLLPSNYFTFFVVESNIITKSADGKQIIGIEQKKDQPVIYEDLISKKFILTNSYEKLEMYNKYIYAGIDLYYHYLKVFESWCISNL